MKCRTSLLLVALVLGLACATSPLGRRQLLLVSDAQMNEMGAMAFQDLQQKLPRTRNAALQQQVECVANAVTAQITQGGAPRSWEVVVFEEPSANAFALPGGKIGVHTGLLEVAANQSQLATVLGHEVAHVLAGHSNERVSTQMATESGLQLIQIMSGAPSATKTQLIGLLGAGAQVGVLLPFSRAQESEADLLGLDLMARAGFDPRESTALWENMSKQGGQPPEILSTHPANETRIRALGERVPAALPSYEKMKREGRAPRCY